MVLPFLKLGALVVKTVSKPVAAKLKQQAGVHPHFREFIVRIAQYPDIDKLTQTNHRLTTKIQRRIYGHATNAEIRPLDEEKAVQDAVDLFGEVFVFSVAGAAVVYEWHRSSRSEARKEEIRKQALEAMRQQDDDLKAEVELLKQRFNELEQFAKGGQGLARLLNFKQTHNENDNLAKAV